MAKDEQRINKSNWLISLKTFITGTLSQSSLIIAIIFLVIIAMFFFLISHRDLKDFYIYFNILFFLLVCTIIFALFISSYTKGQIGTPVTTFKKGNKGDIYVRVENDIKVLQLILPLILPKTLPLEDGRIIGEAKNKENIRELTTEEKVNWDENNSIDMLEQTLAHLKKLTTSQPPQIENPQDKIQES